jgi:long-subunit fatty acid transport protein
MRRLTAAFAACLVVPCVLGSSEARAAGIEYPDNGTIAIGRGGAWAANPSDGLAFQYNPAGLAQQRGWQATLDARLAWEAFSFASTSIQGPTIHNSGPPVVGPSGAVSYGFGQVGPLSDLTLALGATGPSAVGKVDFPDAGVQRYALHSTDYFIGYYSLAVAAAWHDLIRVGVTGQLAHGSAMFDQSVWSGFGKMGDATAGPVKDPGTSFDAVGTLEGTSGWIPTAVVGLTVTPTPDWAIGLSYRPSIVFAAPGTLKVVLPAIAHDAGLGIEGDKAELDLNFAAVTRLGASWQATPRLNLEVDGVYEDWSDMKEVLIKTKNIFVTYNNTQTKLPDIHLGHDMMGAYSGRLGADFDAVPDRLKVRAGYAYESSAIPTKYVSVDFANWQRSIASVGASVRVYGLWVDLAYAHHFIATQKITDSSVIQIVAPDAGSGLPASETMVVGNGTYSAALDTVSLSVRIPLDSLTSAP